jgi:hypothetical protein
VANALQAASCTRLLLSRTLRKSFYKDKEIGTDVTNFILQIYAEK